MTNQNPIADRNAESIDSWQAILAACVASAVGALIYNILPILVGVAQDSRGLSDQSVGFIASMFYVGFGMAACTSYFWIRQVNWQFVTLIAVIIAVAGMGFITITQSYTFLLIGIVIAGGAFGIIYGIGTTILGDTGNPARYYGLKIGSEILLGIILLLTLPVYVIGKWGFDGLLHAMMAITLLLSIAFVWIPKEGTKRQDETQRKAADRTPMLAITSSLLGIFVFFCGMSSVWAYMERLGADAGFAGPTIGQILSLSLFFALFGALMAAAVANKFNRILPPMVGLLIVLVSIFLFTMKLTVGIYAIAACLFNLAFAFTIPFLVTLSANLDFNGRFVVLTVPAIAFGNTVGPAVAGSLIEGQGFRGVMVFAGCMMIMTSVLVISAIKTGFSETKVVTDGQEVPLI